MQLSHQAASIALLHEFLFRIAQGILSLAVMVKQIAIKSILKVSQDRGTALYYSDTRIGAMPPDPPPTLAPASRPPSRSTLPAHSLPVHSTQPPLVGTPLQERQGGRHGVDLAAGCLSLPRLLKRLVGHS